ncbi:hypothetical protein [Breoghania sp. JC706]|uniref:hypothetical protein n=1 Tax=Breoghania sp. JC706 TaxID=3117732 RepID=UPI00300BCF25
MSGPERYFWAALGFVLGLGVALLFLVWAVPEFRNSSFAGVYFSRLINSDWHCIFGESYSGHNWLGPFDGWIFSEDSLAQWVMAILGIFATLISYIALIWLKRTWELSKSSAEAAWRAVSVAREMGEAQVRCYPTIKDVRLGFGIEEGTQTITPSENPDDGNESNINPKIYIILENFGNSPALRVSWAPSIKYMAVFYDGDNPSLRERQSSRRLQHRLGSGEFGITIPSNGCFELSTEFGFSLNYKEEEAINMASGSGGLFVVLLISLYYEDVFGNDFSIDNAFMGGVRMGGMSNLKEVPLAAFEKREDIRAD